jgi:hypothetical protein
MSIKSLLHLERLKPGFWKEYVSLHRHHEPIVPPKDIQSETIALLTTLKYDQRSSTELTNYYDMFLGSVRDENGKQATAPMPYLSEELIAYHITHAFLQERAE